MKKNLDTLGRLIRLAISAVLFYLSAEFKSKFLLLAAAFTLFEALFSWCVLYQILGINHC